MSSSLKRGLITKTILFFIAKVIDLLNTGAKKSNLNVRWDKKSRAFVVDNLFSIECEELDDLVAVLEEGKFHQSHRLLRTCISRLVWAES